MLSDFLCAAHGRLHYINEDHEKVYAIETIKYGSGKNDDGWWDAEKMVAQTKKAIAIFEQAFPDDIALFAFDNSSGHACKAGDALVANRMNLRPGGKQPVMHSTKWGEGIEQSMVFVNGDRDWDTGMPIPPELIGKPKGIKRVLQERGLWRQGLKKQCGRQKKDKSNFEERAFQETMEEYQLRVADRCELGKLAVLFAFLRAKMISGMKFLSWKLSSSKQATKSYSIQSSIASLTISSITGQR